MHRIYENDDIVVLWNSEKCFHAKQCVSGSPKTFNPAGKPWIKLNEAENAEVWQAIEKCPSGALSCLYRHGIDVVMDVENCRSIALDGNKMVGECCYEKIAEGRNIYHTQVLPEYSGKGIAKRLVFKVIEDAERNKEEAVATCSYAQKVLADK